MMYHDAVSSLTHLLTAVWAAFATLILLRLTRRHGRSGRWAVGLYGLSMVLLYAASGLFHGLIYLADSQEAGARAGVVRSLWVFQRLDKSAIFLLIAGSYVPIFVYLLPCGWRRRSLTALGLVTAFGISLIWVFPSLPHVWLVAVYVSMGLIGLVLAPLYARFLGWGGAFWAAVLCGAYLGGALVEVLKWPALVPGYFGPHEFLHVADIVGTLAHFVFVLKFVIVRRPLADRGVTGTVAAGIPVVRSTRIPVDDGSRVEQHLV